MNFKTDALPMPNSELLILNKTDEKTKQNENNAN
jgi:hypothetical protein